MNILLFLIFIVIGVFLLILLFVVGFVRSLFKFGRNKKYTTENKRQDQNPSKPKVFSKNEGEYVDYEDVTDK